jgi:hypothetical protein
MTTPQFGLVAEEVEKVNPDLVSGDAKEGVATVCGSPLHFPKISKPSAKKAIAIDRNFSSLFPIFAANQITTKKRRAKQ